MQMDEEEDEYRPSTGDFIPPSVPIVPCIIGHWIVSQMTQMSFFLT